MSKQYHDPAKRSSGTEKIMEYIHEVLPALGPSLMTVLMILVVTVLYNACRKLLTRVDNNKVQKEKIPEEHDERFATGKHFMIFG